MDIETYIGTCRSRLAQLRENRAAFAERRLSMRSNWGGDITRSWTAELDRRINEQSSIIVALERNKPL
jgi:hypothetical protein